MLVLVWSAVPFSQHTWASEYHADLTSQVPGAPSTCLEVNADQVARAPCWEKGCVFYLCRVCARGDLHWPAHRERAFSLLRRVSL